MPFDGTNYKGDALQTGLVGLQQISNALRFIPPAWHWDFKTVGCESHGCAIGLAWTIWPEQRNGDISSFLGLPEEDMSPIFGLQLPSNGNNFYGKPSCEVTPLDVADAIDSYIAEKE